MSDPSNPLRYPNTGSSKIMTTRGWWLLVLNVVFPGSVQALAGNRRLGRIGMGSTIFGWLFIVLVLVLNAVAQSSLITFFTYPFVMFLLQVGLVYFAILWIVLTFDTLRLVRLVKTGPKARWWIPGVAVVLVALLAGGTLWSSSLVGNLSGMLGTIGVAGPAVAPVDGRYNFLVLGVDSNASRQKLHMGMRPDTFEVLSVDANTGRVIAMGFPRDLHNIPFPASSPMHKIYPYGYTEKYGNYCVTWACLNTVYVDAEINHPNIYPQAKKYNVSSGVFAMMDAAQGITGLKMQFFVMVDMTGLQKLIDALGGVNIYIDSPVAWAKIDTPDSQVKYWIPAGQQHLNGKQALMYARSRHFATGDYERMLHQQKLMAALEKQMNPFNVLSKFEQVSKAGGELLTTNIPQPMFGTLADLAMKSRKAGFYSVAFTPYSDKFKIDAHDPDYSAIQKYIAKLLAPVTPSPSK